MSACRQMYVAERLCELQAEKISRKRGTIIHENIFDRTRHRPGCTHHCIYCIIYHWKKTSEKAGGIPVPDGSCRTDRIHSGHR